MLLTVVYVTFICLIQISLCVVPQCVDLSVGACKKLLAVRSDVCALPDVSDICKDTCGYCPLHCYHCDEVSSPENCKAEYQCSSTSQLCVASERYADDYTTFYTSGCAEKQLCENLFGYVGNRRTIYTEIDKRAYRLHGGCCNFDLCNAHDPGNFTGPPNSNRPPRPTGGSPLLASTSGSVPIDSACSAADIDADACFLLKIADPNICQRKGVAERVCGAMCGTCLECFSCKRAANPDSCVTKETCKLYQKCVTIENLDDNFNIGFKMGCMDEKICNAYFSHFPEVGRRQVPGLSLRGQCCSTSHCNQHGILNNTHTAY